MLSLAQVCDRRPLQDIVFELLERGFSVQVAENCGVVDAEFAFEACLGELLPIRTRTSPLTGSSMLLILSIVTN